jgi:histidyl-tRNA synthetase
MSQKPSIPKGTRDFTPVEMGRRNFIFDTIRDVYKLYGFQPIETPAMENLSSLLGKYGEEGDKLLFKILNSGDFLAKAQNKDKSIADTDSGKLALDISKKGLRYDLTVPFARFVVQHRNEITFPFRRYQIQPVWRADRPQKGRYQEFYQCDADVIGSPSLLSELELVQIIDEVFSKLNIKVEIKLNNRKILQGIAEYIGHPDKFMDITIAIDKLDKIGKEGVTKELIDRGLSKQEINLLNPVLDLKGDKSSMINTLHSLLTSENGKKGIGEMLTIFNYLKETELNNEVVFDLTLARGLNYYTGTIFEVVTTETKMGSLCGGGRYDDLTSIFGLPDVSGVGISFGADRIYDVLNELERFPAETNVSSQILFVNFGPKEEKYCLSIINSLRKKGVRCEIYPEAAKLKKQFSYADNNNIQLVAIAGSSEIQKNTITIKDMVSGEQKEMTLEEVLHVEYSI